MTQRLGDVEARISTVHQLETVISAMRGIAAARSREARARFDGIRTYARSVGAAIGEAIAFLPPQSAALEHYDFRLNRNCSSVFVANQIPSSDR